jgi:DNA-binding NarL/FixJ family response regulator
MTRLRLIIVDDHMLVAQALAVPLAAVGHSVEVAKCLDPAEVLDTVDRFGADAVLLDLRLGGMGASGLDLIGPLVTRNVAVVMLTSESDPLVLAVGIEHGAIGWLPKHAELDDVLTTIERVERGESILPQGKRAEMLQLLQEHRRCIRATMSPFDELTSRENEVLAALVEGLSADEIATRDAVSIATVRTHIRSTLAKLGVHSQLAAVAMARRVRQLPDRDVVEST